MDCSERWSRQKMSAVFESLGTHSIQTRQPSCAHMAWKAVRQSPAHALVVDEEHHLSPPDPARQHRGAREELEGMICVSLGFRASRIAVGSCLSAEATGALPSGSKNIPLSRSIGRAWSPTRRRYPRPPAYA